MRRWWLVIALLLSVGMNVGLLVALALNSPAVAGKQQEAMRPAAAGRVPQLAARLDLEGVERRRFIQRQRQFFEDTAGLRRHLPELRKEFRRELIQPKPDRAHIDELVRQSADAYLALERFLVNDVLDSRELLAPAHDRSYVDLLSRLQLEGPGQMGRLPANQWPWWRREK